MVQRRVEGEPTRSKTSRFVGRRNAKTLPLSRVMQPPVYDPEPPDAFYVCDQNADARLLDKGARKHIH